MGFTLAVGGTDINDNRYTQSNYGSWLNVMAPGVSIITTDRPGSAGYESGNYTLNGQTGTSVSAPHVAGLAGLILSKNSSLAPAKIRSIIQYTAKDLSTFGWDQYFGWGRINAYDAVRSADGQFTLTGSLSKNECWYGTITLTGNVTIPSGFTLGITSGTTVNLNGYYIKSTGGLFVEESGVTWSPENVKIVQGSDLKGHYGSIQSAITNVGSGQVVVAGAGTHTVSADLTIASGKVLQINSGATLNFSGNYKLRVEGTLSAVGTSTNKITFTRSGGTWYGIEFWNGAWLSEIRWANINNAQYGVRMYNTNVVLEDNSIKYNTTGLRFENQSDGAGIIRGNVVAENNDKGIECVQYSDPLLFSSNLIRYNNFYGVYGDNTSAPDLGRYSDQGHNSIYYNGDDVWSTYGGTIYALYNWWGEYPAYPTVSYNVDYSNALSYDPNPGLGKAATNVLSFENLNKPLKNDVAPDTLGMAEVNQAHQAFLDGKFDEALALFDGIVQKYPDHFSGQRALAFMDRTLGKLNRQTESFSRLNAITAGHPSLEIAGLANSITVGHLIKSAQYTDAVAKSQTILNDFPKATLAKYALYDLGSIFWYRLADPKTGETYYRQLIAEWPEDDLSISALATLGEWKPKPNQGGAPILAKAQSVPTAYALAQNFPNPFNPQTLVQYQLPEASHLTLKIYNLFGQEIRTLFAGQREAGYHSEIWNGRDDFGRNVASGVYFYRLSTEPSAAQPNGFSLTRKMVLMQ